jgi:hypothetical protein
LIFSKLTKKNGLKDLGLADEKVLIKSGKFSLKSKRALYGDDIDLEFVVIDATESPIQRPKKSKESTTQGKKDNTP